MQYLFFDGIEVPVKMVAHRNSKRNQRPYFRTQASTLEAMKENLPTMQPKEVVDTTYKHAGGVLNVKSSSEVCRDRTQVYNMKRYKGCTSRGLSSNCNKDLVYDLLEQHYSSESNFVRNVGFDDSVMSVVGLEQQFDDIERFCACDDPTRGSVLGVDPTFNLGDFYVTPTTYEHKLLRNRKTGKHPVFIGPVMIHQNRKHDTYYYFASQLRKMRPGLEGLSAIGTDGEEALSSAFKTVFPGSSHLLCQIHKRDNIMLKLRSMNAKEPTAKQILGDIFGITDGESRFTGLIDSLDACVNST